MIVEYSENFLKEAKKLSKKYKLLKSDLQDAIKGIEGSTELGVALGYNLFKKEFQTLLYPPAKVVVLGLLFIKK